MDSRNNARRGRWICRNESGTHTQGETVEEALANLKEATELYLEVFPLQQGGSNR